MEGKIRLKYWIIASSFFRGCSIPCANLFFFCMLLLSCTCTQLGLDVYTVAFFTSVCIKVLSLHLNIKLPKVLSRPKRTLTLVALTIQQSLPPPQRLCFHPCLRLYFGWVVGRITQKLLTMFSNLVKGFNLDLICFVSHCELWQNNFVYYQLFPLSKLFLGNPWRIDLHGANEFSIPRWCFGSCMAVCPSAMTMNTLLVIKDSLCLHSDAASHSIIHKNVTFNLQVDGCRTADAAYPLTHPQTAPFSHALGVSSHSNSLFSYFFFFLLRIEKTYQEGLWDTEERKGQWLHVSLDLSSWCTLWTQGMNAWGMSVVGSCSGAEIWVKPLNYELF